MERQHGFHRIATLAIAAALSGQSIIICGGPPRPSPTAKPTKICLNKACGKAHQTGKVCWHYYNFGDGWCAGIDVREVNSSEAAKLRRNSAGFCGYQWMVESLVLYGDIKTDDQRKALVTTDQSDAGEGGKG